MSGRRTKDLRRALRVRRAHYTVAEWRAWKRFWTRTHSLPPL